MAALMTSKEFSGAVTGQTVIAADASFAYEIESFTISSNGAACTGSLYHSSDADGNRLMYASFGIGSVVHEEFRGPNKCSEQMPVIPVNTALVFTGGAVGSVIRVQVYYHKRPTV